MATRIAFLAQFSRLILIGSVLVCPAAPMHAQRKLSSSRVVVPNVRICLRTFPLGDTTSKQATTVAWCTSNPHPRSTRVCILSPPCGSDCCAAGRLQTLPCVLPVSGCDKRWYLQAARVSLVRGICVLTGVTTSKQSLSTKCL